MHDFLTRFDVGGDHGEGNLELLEGGRQVRLEQLVQAVALHEASAEREVDHVAPGGVGGYVLDLLRSVPGCVQGADYCAHGGARNDVVARALPFQDP